MGIVHSWYTPKEQAELIQKGLAFALRSLSPGAELVGPWSLEIKTSWQECVGRGKCWQHGVSHEAWPQMMAEAAEMEGSPYDIYECYSTTAYVHFGVGAAQQGDAALQLRAHIVHAIIGTFADAFDFVLWVKGPEGVKATKCCIGGSAHYRPTEPYLNGWKLDGIMPPRDIKFT